ncbi:MAG TPA: hypothetical protein VEJ63_05520 [Planctomycetota bacterium]|nr:hypothetical protein [Planctomycetota bacterium]
MTPGGKMVSKGSSGKTEMLSGHKPSERFTRKPLQARSRASRSERVRVADLVSKLGENVNNNVPENGQTQFNGYKPGHDGESKPPR